MDTNFRQFKERFEYCSVSSSYSTHPILHRLTCAFFTFNKFTPLSNKIASSQAEVVPRLTPCSHTTGRPNFTTLDGAAAAASIRFSTHFNHFTWYLCLSGHFPKKDFCSFSLGLPAGYWARLKRYQLCCAVDISTHGGFPFDHSYWVKTLYSLYSPITVCSIWSKFWKETNLNFERCSGF